MSKTQKAPQPAPQPLQSSSAAGLVAPAPEAAVVPAAPLHAPLQSSSAAAGPLFPPPGPFPEGLPVSAPASLQDAVGDGRYLYTVQIGIEPLLSVRADSPDEAINLYMLHFGIHSTTERPMVSEWVERP